MKFLDALKTDKAQHIFDAALVIILLLILPILGRRMGKYGGGVAMLVGSVIGLIAYLLLYAERVRNRRQLSAAVLLVALSCVLGVVIASAFWLAR